MSLASTQSDIDTALATMLSDIDAAQATYFAANGKYWQGLCSHNTIPANGGTVAADNISGVYPSDQAVTWATFGVTPGTIPAAVKVSAYKSQYGHGYTKEVLFIYSGAFYSKITHSGNNQSQDVPWSGTADTVPPTTLPAPTYTSLSVTTGPEAGGTATTITGTGFQSGATVTFGGVAATSVVVVSATSITCVTPSGTAGAQDVVITNIDDQSVTGTGAFTYTAASFPSVLQSASDTKSGSGDLVITLGAAPTSGNLLVLVLYSNSGVDWTGTTGFTQLSGGGTGDHVYYKVSAGTETTLTLDDDGAAKADEACGLYFEIENVDGSAPYDTSAVGNNTATSPTVTTAENNCLGILCGISSAGSTDFQTVPSGWTLVDRIQRGLGDGVVTAAWKEFATAGATGTSAWDAGTYSLSYAYTISVKP